jgi:hypothetical protein
VEGKRTEKKVYPQWLSCLLPWLRQVSHFDEVDNHNYYLFSSNGYPSILDDIENAIKDINECGSYSHLVICLDADEFTVQERTEEIRQLFETRSLDLDVELKVVVQNRCFETWFLGNRKVYSRNPQDEIFKRYCSFYDVSVDDPELMTNYPGFNRTAQFHEDYLKRMLGEKGIRYTKRNPGSVGEPHYINALKKRIKDKPCHLASLNYFFSFCASLRQEITGTIK